MEYLLGAIVTILAILLSNKYVQGHRQIKMPLASVISTQSYKHSILAPLRIMADFLPWDPPPRQSSEFEKRHSVKILFTDDKAYWIANNSFFVADVNEFGEVIQETQRRVDTMGMDSVELEEMVFIVNKLTEGSDNDSGSAGNP